MITFYEGNYHDHKIVYEDSEVLQHLHLNSDPSATRSWNLLLVVPSINKYNQSSNTITTYISLLLFYYIQHKCMQIFLSFFYYTYTYTSALNHIYFSLFLTLCMKKTFYLLFIKIAINPLIDTTVPWNQRMSDHRNYSWVINLRIRKLMIPRTVFKPYLLNLTRYENGLLY